jgi:hypothetical protein
MLSAAIFVIASQRLWSHLGGLIRMVNQAQNRVAPVICTMAMIGGASLFVAPVQAFQITINATDRGWYNAAGARTVNNTNYFVGIEDGSQTEYRNFFVFDLSNLTGTITKASLNLVNPAFGYSGPIAGLTYNMSDVSTPIPALINGTGGVNAFTDLGGGTTFGSRTVRQSIAGGLINIALNGSAISALNANSGLFAFGGAIANPQPNQFIFAGSTFDLADTQLVLETQPVPAPPALVGTVLTGAIAACKKKPPASAKKA